MQRKVTQVVGLAGTDLDLNFFHVAIIAGHYTDATLKVFLRVKLFWIFKGMARKTEVLNPVETEDDVFFCRPITSHHIPALTEKLYAQWHHVMVVRASFPVGEIGDVNEAILQINSEEVY